MSLSWKAHLFCANFASSVGRWPPSFQAWYPCCCISDKFEAFHVYQSEARGTMNDKNADMMGNIWRIDPREANKFHQARMADHS
jgi:hypothetical protein